MIGKVTVEGIELSRKKLNAISTKNPEFEEHIRNVIRGVLGKARANLRASAQSGLQMKSDPRSAYKAVRFAVYKKIFGGQVNILTPQKAGASTSYAPTHRLQPGQWGGNRRARSPRTQQIMSYDGEDRGFILRFLNDGMTKSNPRVIKFKPDPLRQYVHRGSKGGDLSKYGKTINTGHRGAITARNWFGPISQKELETAAKNLEKTINKMIIEEFS